MFEDCNDFQDLPISRLDRVGPALVIHLELLLEIVEHENVRIDRIGEFGYVGLDFRGSAAKKVRTKRF